MGGLAMRKNIILLAFAAAFAAASCTPVEPDDKPTNEQARLVSIDASRSLDLQTKSGLADEGWEGQEAETKALKIYTGDPYGEYYIAARWADVHTVGHVDTVTAYSYSSWTGERLAGTLQPTQVDKTDCTLEGNLSVNYLFVGSTFRLYFPNKPADSGAYDGQDGTLETIARKFDYATATVTVSEIRNNRQPVFTRAVFENKQSINLFHFSYDGDDTNPITKISLTSTALQNESITVVPQTPGRDFYISIPGSNTERTAYHFKLETENGTIYSITKRANLQAGKFYYASFPVGEEHIVFDPVRNPPLTIEAIEDGEIRISNPLNLLISYGKSARLSAATASNDNPIIIPVRGGEAVCLWGDNSAYASEESVGIGSGMNPDSYTNIRCTSPHYVYGELLSLISPTDYTIVKGLEPYAFAGLFADNASMRNHEDKLLYLGERDATLLPLQLSPFCYAYLFFNCSNLERAPSIYSDNLDTGCCLGMFMGCSSLKKAVKAIADILKPYCYAHMYSGCTSLDAASLPATQLAEGCYQNMFEGCTSLTHVDDSFGSCLLPATQLAGNCYYYMFSGCTSLDTAPALPATQLAKGCYEAMFMKCTSLGTAPALPATQLADSCYESMFYGCTSLDTAPALPATQLAENCYMSMFYGCTSLRTAPRLNAPTLVRRCYREMFYGCTQLNYIYCMATNPINGYESERASNYEATTDWVRNVARNGNFFRKTKTGNLWTIGPNGIPNNRWIVTSVQ